MNLPPAASRWAPLSGAGPIIDYPLGYNPGLDGLRAVAVLAVMFDHFHVPGFVGGGLGVDVFFVLSGYLITSLLILNIGRGQPLGIFYWRRFIRLAPALVFLCTALLLISPLLGAFSQAIWDTLASLLYISNWTRAFPAGAPLFLGNTWSLAIEEQFYLIWPLLLLGMLRSGGRSFAIVASLGLLVVSLSWQRWLIKGGADYARLYNGFDTRCFALLIGCLIALVNDYFARAKRLVRAAGLGGAMFFLAILPTSAWTPMISLGVSLAAGVVIADVAVHRQGPIQSVLSLRPLVAIGRISYAVYLWHYPIMLIVYRHLMLPKVLGAVAGIGLSLLCATVSFFAVERPALRLRNALPPRWTARAGRSAASASLSGLLIGVVIFWRADIENVIYPKPIEIVSYGPQSIRRGESFNVQPDGRSVLWIRTSRSVPTHATVRIGSDILETSVQGTVTVAFVPDAVRDRVGRATMEIVSPDGKIMGGTVSFDVSP